MHYENPLLMVIKRLHKSPLIKKQNPKMNETEEFPEIIFPINLILIDQYQRKDPILIAKYKICTYKNSSFYGGSNIYLNPITCNDNIVIPLILQGYVLNWYHTYLLHLRMDIMEATICQHLYWTGIRQSVRKEVNNCDTCQHTIRSNIKYGKLPAKEAEENHGTNAV